MSEALLDRFFNLFGKEKGYHCINICQNLFFDAKNNVSFCPKSDFACIHENFDGLWLDTDKIKNKRNYYFDFIKSKECENVCKYCEYYQKKSLKPSDKIKTIYLGHWKNCYLDCAYCDLQKNANLLKARHYDITPVLESLIDAKMLTSDTKIVFLCGDASIHPEFDKLLYFLYNFESKNIEINTPALTFRDSIADGITKSIVNIIVNFDAGNKNVYKYIKKADMMDTAIENTKRYLKLCEPGEKRVASKFTIIKGANDAQKEITDWFILCNDLGIKKLYLDIDNSCLSEKFRTEDYIVEIIVFAKRISDLNDVKLIFSDKLEMIYSAVKNPGMYSVV